MRTQFELLVGHSHVGPSHIGDLYLIACYSKFSLLTSAIQVCEQYVQVSTAERAGECREA